MEASKASIRAAESIAGSNVYEALSSSDRRSDSLTSSESTPILSTRLKNKTITSEKLQSKLNLSWPSLWKGWAMEEKRVITSEKAKPTMSCTVEPGRMSTQTPTRNSCGTQARASSLAGVGNIHAVHRAARLLRDLDHFPPEHRRLVVLVQEGQATREIRRLLGKNGLACGQ